MSRYSFLHPEFLLFFPIILLILYWINRNYSLVDLHPLQKALSLAVRAAIFVLLASALAGLSETGRKRELAVAIAVDTSPSIPPSALEVLKKRLREILERSEKNELYLISFAQTAGLVEHPGQLKPSPEMGTDLARALRYAASLLPPDKIRRILLISDGRETGGNSPVQAQRLKASGIKVFTANYGLPYPKEVFIQKMSLPEEISPREPFYIKLEIFSNYKARNIPIKLYRDGFLISSKKLDLRAGLNFLKFKVRVEEKGLVTFRAELYPPEDRFRDNNRYTRYLHISGPPKVLYLEGEPSRARFLAGALRKHKIRVEVRSAYGIPNTLEGFEKFDLIILSDIPAHRISRRQMNLLRVYVRELGGGFLMVGGENSFGPGGYYQTPIEEMLPVRFLVQKKKDTPSLAMVLVIDKSGSMAGPKIALAREAAKATVRLLADDMQIGIVAFDATPYEIVNLQPAINKYQIISDISRIKASGGTRIAPALEMAYRMLSGVRAKVKHVILLSDGQDSQRGIFEIVQAMNAENITVSTIALGRSSDRSLLRSIAEAGGGRFYYTEDPYNIPKLFTKETSKVTRSSFVEEPFRPRVLLRSRIFKGIDFSRAPFLLGYVSTKAKPRARVLLQTELGEPLLAIWRYGLGTAAAFTSDVKNRWAVNWLRWPGYSKFFAQLVREVMRPRADDRFQVKIELREERAIVTADAIDTNGQYIDFLKASGVTLDPKFRKLKFRLHQEGPGFYRGEFPVQRFGPYLAKVRFFRENRFLGFGQASASYSYPSELLVTGEDREKLRQVAKLGGGKFIEGIAVDNTFGYLGELFDTRGEVGILVPRPLWPHLLLMAIALLLLDIAVRRIRLLGRSESLVQLGEGGES